MFNNYVKTAWRNIVRHKGYSFINIFGLATGMAACLLILLWVLDELSFDGFHKNKDSIYRVLQDVHLDRDTTWAINQGPLGPALQAAIPEITKCTRGTARRFRIRYNDKRFDEIVEFADPAFFEMFDFPLVKGDAKAALAEPHSIVISEDMAVKYFAGEDPLGKVLRADDQYSFVVTGVTAEAPRNSHLRPQFIIPFVFGRELEFTVDNWGNSQFTTYVMLKNGVSQAAVEGKIARFLDDKPTLEKGTILRLQPLTRIHLYSNFEYDRFGAGDIKYIQIFSIAAFFILLIAGINFMNLSTARSAARAREVGMRKVLGAGRSELIRQFFIESVFIAFAALLSAILLVELLLPLFNDLANKEMALDPFGNPAILFGILGIAILTAMLSGSYPALFFSSFRPIKVLKGNGELGNSKSLSRKALVITQFSLSLIMIIGTLIVFKQLDYIQNKKLGYNKENLLYFMMRREFVTKYDTLKNELVRHPNILSVTRTTAFPDEGALFINSKWRWEGQNPKEEVLMYGNLVDHDYFKTFGMEIAQGRGFSKDHPTDQTAAVLNEEAVKRMGMASPIGMELANGEDKFTIVGIVKNYHFLSLHKKIEPLVLILAPEYCRGVVARIKSEGISSTIAFLQKKWGEFSSEYPFSYGFMDQRLGELYRTEKRAASLIQYFTLLTIFISCLGLFGMASFMTERRTKEIGIRKVLGASVSRIVLMLSREFTFLVLSANVIGWPAAYFLAKKWLQNFAYRTPIRFEIFILGAMLSLAIAWLTVSYQTVKAARANPVDSLRYE